MRKNPKTPGRWVAVNQCEIETRPGQASFKQVILDICDAHRDDWSREVEVRVIGAHSILSVADAQYHTHCYNKFRKVAIDSTKSDSCKPCVDKTLQAVVSHMSANKSCTWTITELHAVYTENDGHLGQNQMLVHLHEYLVKIF